MRIKFTSINGGSHARPFVGRNPLGQQSVRARHNRPLAQTLNEAHERQPEDAALARSDRHCERKHRVDQHAVAEEAQRTVLLGQHAEGDLGDDVAIEERGQDEALGCGAPGEFTTLGGLLDTRNGEEC